MLGGAAPLEDHGLARRQHGPGRLQPPQADFVVDRMPRRDRIHRHEHTEAAGEKIERRLREAYFVAMVTPALKHLKKVLQDLPATP